MGLARSISSGSNRATGGERLLCDARLLPYKRVDLVVQAATRAGVGVDMVDVAAATEVREGAPLRISGAPRWNVVVIARVDANTVHVAVPGRSLRCNYGDLGMMDRRTRRPLRHWEMLIDLCEEGGVFVGRRYGKADATKKVVSRLSGALGQIFGLRQSAFHRYVRGEGWRTRFRALPHPPERT